MKLGFRKKGILFVISAPAGTGKTTLVTRLIKENPLVVQSLSRTTRAPREDEVNGEHYQFLSVQEFKAKRDKGEFLEYVKLYGDYYGTSKLWVNEHLASGKHVILVIDTQGAMQLKGKVPAVFIFIAPPSMEALRERLLKRRTESDEVIERRLIWAKEEMEAIKEYNYEIINDDLDEAYDVLTSIIVAEEHKITGENNARI